jgi:threonyl-tRNA synthetase
MNAKIHILHEQRVPYVIIIGKKERDANMISIKNLRNNEQVLIHKEELVSFVW